MGSWYTIGLVAGIATGGGVIAAGAVARSRVGVLVGGAAAVAVGIALGFAAGGALPPVGGGVGAVAGIFGAAQIVRGALRRGGTEAGTAMLVGVGGLVLAALALVPALGFVEAVVVPLLGLRVRRRSAERYAGLRTLAK